MNKSTLLLLMCIALPLLAYCTEIDAALLNQKFHPLDSSAHAAYVKKDVEISYNFANALGLHLDMKYHFIIKVYDELGESYGTFEIPYYEKGGSKEKVRKIKAKTHFLLDGKVNSVSLNKKDIYKEETSDHWRKMKFALPNVKPGSVIEVEYTVSTPYIYSIPKWYFQNKIPTDQSTYTIDVPGYFTLTPVPSGTIPLQSDQKRISNSKHGEVRHTISGTNIMPIKEDKYVLNENDYRSGVKFEIFSTKFPNQPVEFYSKDWNAIAENLNEVDHFGKQLKRKLSDVNEIIDQAKALEKQERIKFIYDYVRSNYAWNGKYGIGSYDGLKKVVQNKTGNVGDINLLLTNLLMKSNINAYPVVMKSRYDGVLNTSFPTLTELDYTIVYILQDENDFLLLDATSKLTPLGELPLRALNLAGVIIKPKSGQVINMPNNNEYKIQTVSEYKIDSETNSLVGSSQRKRSGYAATKFRLDLEKEDEEIDEEFVKDSDDQEDDIESYNLENTYEVTSIKNIDDIYKPISLKYTEELYTCSKVIGDKIFIDGTLDFGIKKNPFEDSVRSYPIFYNNIVLSKSVASLTIPEGYQVESLPEKTMLMTPSKAANFKYEIIQRGQKLIIYYIFNIAKTFISPEEYPALKSLYESAATKATEKIILTKV